MSVAQAVDICLAGEPDHALAVACIDRRNLELGPADQGTVEVGVRPGSRRRLEVEPEIRPVRDLREISGGQLEAASLPRRELGMSACD